MKIAVAQLNPVVGDITGNLKKAIDTFVKFSAEAVDLLVFPELFLAGYPPRDLLEKPWFLERASEAVQELARTTKKTPGTGMIIGTPTLTGKASGKGLYNSAVLISDGEVLFKQHKSLLPTYDVFDEARYFDPAANIAVIPFKDEILGISICEDAWNGQGTGINSGTSYNYDPIAELVRQGATILINVSASPFNVGKEEVRYRLFQNHARRYGVPFVYVNQVGGNDELVFDGRSMCLDRNGEPVKIFSSFREETARVDMNTTGTPGMYSPENRIETVYRALTMGLRDYMKKCGFSQAVLGLSGGIDSAVTCCLAAEAVGPDNVVGVSMPSPYSSEGSVEDSRKLASELGVGFKVIPIGGIFGTYNESLAEHFRGKDEDITEENIQARIRGNILMALSNKFGYLLLSTGNKSEMAVGYCTLYGDMSGGLSVISDVPKTMVYELARFINRDREIIPWEIIEKPPSAELKPGQLDQDTLPPYDVLDSILSMHLDEGRSIEEITASGYDYEIVRWIINNVNRNEYKRRQAAPGLKVTTKAFGIGRRMPIAAKYD